MNRKIDIVKFLASMVIFGTNGLLVNHMTLSSAEIVLMRTSIGFLFLAAVVFLTGKFDFAALKEDRLMATIGGASLGLGWMLMFTGYREASISLATLTYYCGPILVLAFSPVLFREKLTWNKLLAIAAVAAGMICITGSVGLSATSKGLICSGGAALMYAVLIVCNKRVKKLSGLHCATYELLIAFFVVLLYLIFTGAKLPVVPAKNELIYVLIIGLVNTGLAYYLYFSAMMKLSGQSVALICYIDPLTALLVSAAFIPGEMLTAIQIVGAVLILGGACLGEFKFKSKNTN